MRTLTLLTVLVTALAWGESNPELEKANRLLSDQKFADASKALDAAGRVSGNSREVVIKIYELQGVVYAQLGQVAKAKDAFQSMLSLDPKRELTGKIQSKVLAAFTAAKEWSTANPSLEFKSAKAAVDDKGKVMQLAAKVKGDALKLSRKVRFHLRPDEARWSEQDSDLQGAYAAANTEAAGVEWWAELLGDNERVLMVVGSESNPVREGRAAKEKPSPTVGAETPKIEEKVAVAEKPEPAAAVVAATEEPKPEVQEDLPSAPSPSSGLLRPVGYAVAGVGVAALAVGIFFGIQSNTARSTIDGATKNAQGQVVGLTQKKAFELDGQARSNAVIANVLLTAGAIAGVAGGVCVILGNRSPEAATVAVAPTAGGVVVSGNF